MTEIRTIRPDETDAFLRLLCNVFNLDFARAQTLFREEPLFDLNRKWALFEGGQMVSILTTTPLEFGWGPAIGIAGVATLANRQGEGFARRLLEKVLVESEKRGEGPALLFAADTRLYESIGFEGIDRVVRGPIVSLPLDIQLEPIPVDDVKAKYTAWSGEDHSRLRRDARRWKYWLWQFRESFAYRDGYLCLENTQVRELVLPGPEKKLPVPLGTEWIGLASMTDQFEIPLGSISVPMYLMGYNFPGIPQLFMTDQF
ncbi:MAG: GNAT family N-acetyltransferase [Armatimonadetes bacterium]|nr:GNAT family N-acetyltransferase [Armatimonadota bacterium]